MKNKHITAFLALFLGFIGVHRFYLGQRLLGILYILLFFAFGISFIVALIDFLGFLFMNQKRFDYLYNRKYFGEDFKDYLMSQGEKKKRSSGAPLKKKKMPEYRIKNKYDGILELKKEGKELFNQFDYHEAIEVFKKVLAIKPSDASAHFNLGCSYSIIENKEKAYRHLALAIENGFDDFEKIKTHPKLAFLRVQPDWDERFKAQFKDSPALQAPGENLLDDIHSKESLELPDEGKGKILVKLKELKDLRDRGEISDSEFTREKKRLL